MTGPGNGTSERKEDTRGTKLPPRVERRVRASRALLVFEALLPALWPAAGLAGLFVALALFGFFSSLPSALHWTLLAGFGALFVWLLWRGFRGFTWPSRTEALRHLEKSSGLPHSPLSAYEDVAAANTGDEALWAAHRRWIAERLTRLRLGLPASILAGRDPYALRAAVLLLLVIAIAGTGPGHLARLGDALLPGAAGARAANIEAWITPPAYTGKPPLYLEQEKDTASAGDEPVTAPEGSTLSIRVHGLKNPPVLERHDGERERPEELETVSAGNYAIDASLEESADVALTEGGRMIRAWRIEVTPDEPPAIELAEPIAQSASGALRFAYKASDDFGVASAEARIALDRSHVEKPQQNIDAPQPRVSAPDVSLNLPTLRPRETEGESYAELMAHPWAGLPVTITLAATDDRGQEGLAEPVDMLLPAREFTKPLARAIVEQRRRLALDPRSGASVARFIDNFTQDAERYIEDKVVYLSLRAAYWRLTEAERDTDLTGIYDLLWSVALRIEDGDLSLAERDLRDARKALADALANGAGNEEIAELMQELKEAFNRYMEALAAQMQSGDMPMTSEFPDGDVETVDRQQLQNMLDAIGELAQSGARDQAQAMLEQLESILENMQVPNEQARMTPGEQAMADAIQEMGELITKQRELMDRTFRELERLRRDPESDRNLFMESEEGEGGGGTEEGQEGEGGPALAEDQEDLNDELDRILKQLQDSTEPPDALLEALNAMKTAKDRLVRDRKDLAVGSQGQAIERMQEGAQAMADKLMEGKSGRGRGQGQARTDPFGRPTSQSGSPTGEDVAVPDRIDMQRARQILEELRERARELGRPEIELDYLDRLLRRF
ncbi:MAG: TIGR02302 family protein [Parvibaculum sp.]|uniref:TIGR02302 family protein n=1 Tax=Parvibaculum sp. TaxID=2024848 RepID=UPI0032ECBE24